MFEATLTRPIMSLARFIGLRKGKKAPHRGPLPTWINDAQLSEQLLKDTGLSAEDLGGHTSCDETKPSFMQQHFW